MSDHLTKGRDYWAIAHREARAAGAALRNARLSAVLSREDVARHIKRAAGTLACWEVGGSRPGEEPLRDLCCLLGLDFDAINRGFRWAKYHPYATWQSAAASSLSSGERTHG